MSDPNPDCPECRGHGRIEEGTCAANSEGGEDWREIDCPLCFPPKPRRRATWQHEETGYIFTKEIPAGEPTPKFPRRFVISEEPI